MITTVRKQQVAKLSKELRRAFDLAGEGNFAEALPIYQGIAERLRALGHDSGFLLWHMAIANDNLGELEKAFHHIAEALETDPLAQPFRNSFDIIVGRIRAALAAEARAVDDPSTPRLYDLLLSSGEADVPSHAAMARFLVAKGDPGRARQLADALVVLHPGDPLSWRCKAEVARAAGDAATADACLAEAAVRGSAPAPFAVPGVAQG
jgi:tetratricopeptide (TPR) repeat protein